MYHGATTMRMRFIGALAGVLLIATAGALRAAGKPVEIQYEADPDCPSVEAFLSEVRLKAAHVEVVPSQEGPAPVRVALHASEGRFVGKLELRREQRVVVRELSDASCKETASALAFVVALALVPEKTLPEPDDPAPESLVVESTRSVTPPVVIDRQPNPTAAPSTVWQGSAGVDVGFRTAPLPSGALAERVFIELRPTLNRGFAPTLGLAIANAGPSTLTTSEGTTRIWWLAGRLSLCPVRIPLGARLDLVPCVGTHLGVLGASGSPFAEQGQGRSAAQPWVDGVAELRADLRPTETLGFRLGVEAIAVATRSAVAFDNPNALVFQVPTVAVGASVGVALRIW